MFCAAQCRKIARESSAPKHRHLHGITVVCRKILSRGEMKQVFSEKSNRIIIRLEKNTSEKKLVFHLRQRSVANQKIVEQFCKTSEGIRRTHFHRLRSPFSLLFSVWLKFPLHLEAPVHPFPLVA